MSIHNNSPSNPHHFSQDHHSPLSPQSTLQSSPSTSRSSSPLENPAEVNPLDKKIQAQAAAIFKPIASPASTSPSSASSSPSSASTSPSSVSSSSSPSPSSVSSSSSTSPFDVIFGGSESESESKSASEAEAEEERLKKNEEYLASLAESPEEPDDEHITLDKDIIAQHLLDMDHAYLSLGYQDPSKNPFRNTDLIIFAESYEKVLPSNGILLNDFDKMLKLHDSICSGKTKFILPKENSAEETLLRGLIQDAFTKLMIGRQGRDFIQTLIDHPSPMKIAFRLQTKNRSSKMLFPTTPSGELADPKVSQDPITILLRLENKHKMTELANSKKEDLRIQQKRDLRIQLIECPFFITLAHELLHTLHYLNDEKGDKKLKSQSDPLKEFHSQEEKRTITGMENSLPEVEGDKVIDAAIDDYWSLPGLRDQETFSPEIDEAFEPRSADLIDMDLNFLKFSENYFRVEHKLPPRINHLGIHKPKDLKITNSEISQELADYFFKILQYDLRPDIQEFIKINPKLYQFTYQGKSIIYLAAKRGYKVVRMLMIKQLTKDFLRRLGNEISPFFAQHFLMCAKLGYLDYLREMISKGDLTQKSYKGYPILSLALLAAAEENTKESAKSIKLLEELGTPLDFEFEDEDRKGAEIHFFQYLVEHRAHISLPYVIKLLGGNSDNLLIKDDEGNTLLHSLLKGRPGTTRQDALGKISEIKSLIHFLLGHGLKADTPNKNGVIPFAMSIGLEAEITSLLEINPPQPVKPNQPVTPATPAKPSNP